MIAKTRLSAISLALAGWAMTGSAGAQIATSLRLVKQDFVAGEPVLAEVTVTNHAGQALTFAGDERLPWLNFTITDRHGELVSPRSGAIFGKMTVQAGESMAREVDLSRFFQLSEPGNYSASALVRVPGAAGEGTSTNRVLFNQNPGSLYWTQKVGIPGRPGQTREFRVINYNNGKNALIYAKVIDNTSGQNVRTFPLGEVLLLRKPLVTVDREQRLHVMFLSTPTMWLHCLVDTDGRLVAREIHQRGDTGDPRLLTYPDGTVRVSNSIPYDEKAAAEAKAKVRKASERPAGTY